MNEPPPSDAWLPRRELRITSASSHPELLSGDLAMPPQTYVSMTSMNRAMSRDRSRRAWACVLAVGAVAALLMTSEFTHGTSTTDISAEKQRLVRSCLEWHLAASAAVSRLVQSTRDNDLLQVNDSIFRMRRARRNCEAGWYVLACQDYHAVVSAMPGTVMARQVFSCARVVESAARRN